MALKGRTGNDLETNRPHYSASVFNISNNWYKDRKSTMINNSPNA